jgi:hypothetical protein
MVRSVTVFDEDFTDEDKAAAMEWQTEQAMTCSGCGGFLDETTAPHNDGRYDAEMIACHRCSVRDATERAFRERPNARMDGLRVRTWEID